MKNLMIAMIAMAILALTSVAAVPQFGAEAPIVSVSGNSITITGTVIDAVEATNVELICGINTLVLPVTDGAYTATTVYGGQGCNAGIAVLKLGDAETVVSIPEQLIIAPKGGQNKDEPAEYDFRGFVVDDGANNEVPEFSIITLGLAIVGVGLGVAMLRKQE
jgi:hypothetical protein